MRELDLTIFTNELASLSLRPGLLFGPGITRAPNELAAQFHEVFAGVGLYDLFGPDGTDVDYPEAVDAAAESPAGKAGDSKNRSDREAPCAKTF
jgi:hypothetical protein